MAYPGDAPDGCFAYVAGGEAIKGAEEAGFDQWELPAGGYVVCGFEAVDFEQLTTVVLNKAVKYSGLWLEKHPLTME